ncbi:TetR/AcrR family transcriptional regulator [Rhizobium rosettiformans]|uniref:TetR/AcrR family transcriptional regulator n=1 Tax=Rhizobium rosettiformans TaxID=1368430 RepID=A0ABX7EXK0_9HYPH|nr:TetR/AcrR family transcriptional regulator [Rhizobium rosettiformans]QRF52598.1 TetR/AcrR family transcriptional regulator [Rhizobium rosettiformans]
MTNDPPDHRDRILDTAAEQVRRFGEAKTNVVDIAKAMGLSHSAIYRHFRSKADIFDALAARTMAEEAELAARFVNADGSAGDRLRGLVLALHRSKRAKLGDDPEIHGLYRRIVTERPDLVADYARRMTVLVRQVLEDGVNGGEFHIPELDAAAGVVRDAVTVFIHPAHVEQAVLVGLDMEPRLHAVMDALTLSFSASRRA